MFPLLLKSFLGFVRSHLAPVLIVALLVCTHTFSYYSGSKNAKEYYFKQQIADLDKAVKASEQRSEIEKDLLTQASEALSKIKEIKSQVPKQVDHYVIEHPKDSSCNLNSDDVELLRSIIEKR